MSGSVASKTLSPARYGSRAVLVTLLKLVIIALAAFLIVRLAAQVGWADFRRELGSARPAPLVAALACLFARWWIWQHRWSLALTAIGEVGSWRRRFAALTASILVNHVTPTARVFGGVVRSRYLSRPWGGPFARVYASVLYDQLVHHAVIGLLTWIAFVGVAAAIGQLWLAVGGGAALVLFATLVARRARRESEPDARLGLASPLFSGARRKVERLAPILDQGRETLRLIAQLLRRRRLVARSAAWSALVFAVSALAQWLLFVALGADLPALSVAAVVGLGGFAGALFGTPGGIGSTEAAMISGFAALGVQRVDAVTAVLLFRGLHYALVFGCGVPALAALEWQRRHAVRPLR